MGIENNNYTCDPEKFITEIKKMNLSINDKLIKIRLSKAGSKDDNVKNVIDVFNKIFYYHAVYYKCCLSLKRSTFYILGSFSRWKDYFYELKNEYTFNQNINSDIYAIARMVTIEDAFSLFGKKNENEFEYIPKKIVRDETPLLITRRKAMYLLKLKQDISSPIHRIFNYFKHLIFVRVLART